MRLIVRRVRPTRRHLKKLTAFEKRASRHYCITATNIGRMWGIAGSGHAQFLDVLHRSPAGVEDGVRTNKAMRLGNLPSASWEVNRGWVLDANLAADLDAWLRLLTLHDIDDLTDAEPDTMRFRLYHLPTCPPASPTTPPPMAADRADLALSDRVYHLLAATHRPPSRHLTIGRQPRRRPGRTTTSTLREPWPRRQPERYARAPPAITRNKQGKPIARSGNHSR